MKRGTKICVIIACSLLGVGLVLLMVGTAFGGFGILKAIAQEGEVPFVHVGSDGYHAVADRIREDIIDQSVDEWEEDMDDLKESMNEAQEDFHDDFEEAQADWNQSMEEADQDTQELLAELKQKGQAYVTENASGKWDDSFAVSDVRKLDLDVHQGSIYVMKSTDDAIKIASSRDNALKCTLKDGELKIARTDAYRKKETNVYIMLPEGKIFEEIDVDMAAGVLYIEEMCGTDIDLQMDAGVMLIEAMEANKLDAQMSAGKMAVAGELKEIDAECNMGAIELNVAQAQEDYNYNISCAAGKIMVGTDSFEGLSAEKTINNNAKQEMDLECNMGAITVNFSK